VPAPQASGYWKIHVAIAIQLLAELNIQARKRSLSLLTLARDPVELVAVYLVRSRGLNREIVKSH
jgi:hypothetical protein